MSKREVQLFEIVDEGKWTIAFAHTATQARRLAHADPGATFKVTNVPLRPDHLADFLTTLASRVV